MEIKYSKFDFNKNDIGFFLFFMIYIQPQLLFSKNMEDILVGSLFLSIAIFYFIYRFYLVWILKKKGEIRFYNELIEIKGEFFVKKLGYRNIRNLTIRKNYLNSYDIVINYDESINFFDI
ncbi:hypothetical protein EII29_11130 [Leptotrichia sp. OH3620_COT-345]|uniref:hypothetical protein n=1 Tax=Leptotrichia sp. OH3620_COT-345 TaxID=2491048 RepID=UPI000F64BD16|nr:hypothetical protein [Leptotrichia sp. OH3620_COT-345]RRD37594.1 hypothetical protein EII29_11130 [Leptotrichia sp. OH3620_COT-345]